jgi:predicted HAD superfamily Cof-like phosphohydrolase
VKRVNTNNPPKDGKVNKQQTIHGRNLEYPAPTRLNNIPIRQELSSTQSVELMRSSSASSKHFVDRGIKSAAIKSRNEEFN